MIQTVDSDVLVLAIAAVQQIPIDGLWLAFATGKSFIYLPTRKIAFSHGPEIWNTLSFLHAFSGCGTVSENSTVNLEDM